MRPDAINMFKLCNSAYHQITPLLLQIDAYQEHDCEEQADYAYALKQAEELIDSLRKKIKSVKETREQLACITAISLGQTSAIKTDHVTASINPKQSPKIKTEAQKGAALKAIGVDPALSNVVSIHWKGVQTYIEELAVAGKPIPFDMDDCYTEWKLSPMRSRKKMEEYCDEKLTAN